MSDRKLYIVIFLLLLAILGLTGYYLHGKGVFDISKDKKVVENEDGQGDGDDGLFKTKKGVAFTLTSPLPNSTVDCKFQIVGDMPSKWFFEGTFPYEIMVGGKLVHEGSVQTEDDWTKKSILHFVADVDCGEKCIGDGEIILKNENPSGLKKNEDSYTIPIKFPSTCAVTAPVEVETMQVKVFFANTDEDPDSSRCEVTFPVTRTITKTQAVGRASLNELLKGVTSTEKARKYYTAIPEGVVLKGLTIKEGVAFADFNSKLTEGVGGTCLVDRIRSQIRNTLQQFPTVKNVVIAVDGKTEGVLEP